MIMRKWLISAVILTLALGTAGVVTAFALTSGGGSDSAEGTDTGGPALHGDPTYEEWLSNYQPNQGPVTSIDDIDPNVCTLIHNINACTPEELEELGWAPITGSITVGEVSPGLPSDDESLSDFGDGRVVTSIDDIDPNVCNLIHNINACSQEELEELGMVGPATMRGPTATPTFGLGTSGPALHGDPTYEEWLSNHALPEDESASTLVTTQDEGGGIEPGFEVEDSPEPLFVDGEHQYHQSLNDAIAEDCGLAGGTAYVTSDGEVGCVVAQDVEDSGKELVSSSQPPTVEPQPAPDTK